MGRYRPVIEEPCTAPPSRASPDFAFYEVTLQVVTFGGEVGSSKNLTLTETAVGKPAQNFQMAGETLALLATEITA
jgi:hypothetical protein